MSQETGSSFECRYYESQCTNSINDTFRAESSVLVVTEWKNSDSIKKLKENAVITLGGNYKVLLSVGSTFLGEYKAENTYCS